MKSKCITLSLCMILAIFVSFGSTSAVGSEQESASDQTDQSITKIVEDGQGRKANEDLNGPTKKIGNSYDAQGEDNETRVSEGAELIAADDERIAEKINYMTDLMSSQNQMIKELEARIDSQPIGDKGDGLNFEQWAGILLGSVAVIVTTLGVGVGFLSFFGYREITRRSSEIATEVAGEIGRREISKKMEEGYFDSTIVEAVEKVAFRGIIGSDEYDKVPSGET